MLKRREKQQKMNIVIMEQMVPENHLLRKVDRAVDFSFIYKLCAPLYCNAPAALQCVAAAGSAP